MNDGTRRPEAGQRSSMALVPVARAPRRRYLGPVLRAAAVLLLFFVFLVGIKGLGDGFKLLGRDFLDSLFAATANPLLSLMVGILATTLVQSSSVSTAMIVGLVAAPENALPLANAVPMIMGANIGTTVTNTVVSLAHMGRREEFRRAFAAATCHDFFNFLTVAVLLPVELATGYLRHSATWLASHVGGVSGVSYESPLDGLLKAGLVPLKSLVQLLPSQRAQAVLTILLSGALIVTALILVVRLMRAAMESRVEAFVTRVFGRSVMLSLLVGAVVTVMVQSSSITTALLVPLAGAGVVSLSAVFPITVGANIGTTMTALLATLAASGPNAQAGLSIALVHLLFNVTGAVMILGVPAVRRVPLAAARRLANVAVRSRRWALAYVAGLFYGVPALLLLVDRLLR